MTVKRLVLATWTLLACFAAHALGQTPDRRDAVDHVHAACPGLILQDHAFTDAVATLLYQSDDRWGRNGKRGNVNDPSHDAIAYRDARGPGGVLIVDIIAAAGGPDARPAWQDVTQATIDAGTVGAWVRPSGVLPACLSHSPTPPVVTPPVPEPPPLVLPDLEEVLVALRSIENRLTVLEHVQNAHVVDIKERTDVIRVTLEQLDAFLRRSRILRY